MSHTHTHTRIRLAVAEMPTSGFGVVKPVSPHSAAISLPSSFIHTHKELPSPSVHNLASGGKSSNATTDDHHLLFQHLAAAQQE